MKKGFTIIELIIALSLIVIIGTSSVVVTVKKNNNTKDLETKETSLFDMAKVYISTETDENGITYQEGIFKGGSAVFIPVNNLKSEGYLSENDYTYLSSKINNFETQYLVAAVITDTEGTECNGGKAIEFKASWDLANQTEPIYLCDYTKLDNDESSDLEDIIKKNSVKLAVDLTKNAISNEVYNTLNDSEKARYTSNENGLFGYFDPNENTEVTENNKLNVGYYYYRGAVNNNYVKFGKDGNNKDLIWRIVYFTTDKKMKLVLDEVIPIKITKKNGTEVTLNKGDIIIQINDDSNNDNNNYRMYVSANDVIDRFKGVDNNTNKYTMNFKSSDLLTRDVSSLFVETTWCPNNSDLIRRSITYSHTHSIYYQTIINWYNTLKNLTKQKIQNISYDNNFCITLPYKWYSILDERRIKSSFACDIALDDKLLRGNISENVGFLTTREAQHAGIQPNTNISNSDNYLIAESPYLLASHSTDECGFDEVDINLVASSNNNYLPGRSSGYYHHRNKVSKLFGTNWINFSIDNRVINDNYSGYATVVNISANTIKPVISIDLNKTNFEYNHAGTQEDPYIIVV